MKRLILLFILLFATTAFASDPVDLARLNMATVGAAVSASAVTGHCDNGTTDGSGNTVLKCEDFDGATECLSGFSSNCRSAWTNSGGDGTLTFNYTTTKLEGNYSAAFINNMSAWFAITGTHELWFYFIFKPQTVAIGGYNSKAFVTLLNSSQDTMAYYSISNPANDGVYKWNLYDGNTADSTATVTAGTTYYVWGYYHGVGSGSSVLTLWVSTTTTKPGTATVTMTNGTSYADIAYVTFGSVATQMPLNIFDHIRVSNAEIGSDPP